RGIKIDPANDAQHKSGLSCKSQQVLGFGDGSGGLHQDGRVDIALRQDRTQIARLKIAADGGERRRQPAVVAAVQAPEMLMAVDDHRNARAPNPPGTGTSCSRKPAFFRSLQNAAGILVLIIRRWLFASLAVRAPGMTLATTGWARQNCSAASAMATSCAAQMRAIFFTLSCI